MEELRIEIRRIKEKAEILSTNENLKIIILSILLIFYFIGIISFYFIFLAVVSAIGLIIYFKSNLSFSISFLLISFYFYGRSICKNFSKEELLSYQGKNPVKLIRKKEKESKIKLAKYYILTQKKRKEKREEFEKKQEQYLENEETELNTWEGFCIMYCPSIYGVGTSILELVLVLIIGILSVLAVSFYLIVWVGIIFTVGKVILEIVI